MQGIPVPQMELASEISPSKDLLTDIVKVCGVVYGSAELPWCVACDSGLTRGDEG